MESPTPKLTFKPTGLLSDAAYGQVQEVMASDVVQAILGSEGIAAAAAEAAPAAAEDDLPVVEVKSAPAPVAEKPKAAPKPKAEPKPEPVPVAAADVEIPGLNLDDLNFDD